MKIRNRLTLQFMIIVSVILLIVLTSVYYLTSINRKTIFNELLRQRTTAVANYFLEKDEVNSMVFSNFQREFSKALPGEIIQLFDSTNHANFIPLNNSIHFTPSQLDEIRESKEVKFKDGDRRSYGIYYLDNQGNFVIIVSAIDVQGRKELSNLRLLMITGFAVSLLLMFFAGVLFSKNALSPIQEIVNSVNTISSSNLHLRLNEGKGKDEIAQLAVTFNKMLDRLETSFNLQQAFVNNASHELRTPLTAIIGEIEVLLGRERTPDDYKAGLSSMQSEALQMKEMITGLLNLVRAGGNGKQLTVEEVRLDEVLNDVKSAKLHENAKSIINLSVIDLPDDPSQLEVAANRQLLYMGISNIIDNAIKFSHNQPVNCILKFESGKLVLKIADLGIGISKVEFEKIFQPFYRSSDAQSFPGHGIGLSLAETIFRLFGASLSFSSALGKGTTFVITFPEKK